MNILLIGSGGREHSLAWKIKQSLLCTRLFVAPGNPGMAKIAEVLPVKATDIAGINARASSAAAWSPDRKIAGVPKCPASARINDLNGIIASRKSEIVQLCRHFPIEFLFGFDFKDTLAGCVFSDAYTANRRWILAKRFNVNGYGFSTLFQPKGWFMEKAKCIHNGKKDDQQNRQKYPGKGQAHPFEDFALCEWHENILAKIRYNIWQ